MKTKGRTTGKIIYATCIVYVLLVVMFFQFTKISTEKGHISNFIFNIHEPSAPLPTRTTDSNKETLDFYWVGYR